MQQKEITIEDLKKELNRVIDFNDDRLLNLALDGLSRGRSIVVDAVSYLGNGSYEKQNKRGRYKYKLIVPVISKAGELYSTDLFKDDVKYAIRAKYALYHTQQMVVDIIAEIKPDFDEKRMEFGYTQEKYGYYKLKINSKK